MARPRLYYSADRTVRALTETRYLPAAVAYRERVANERELGRRIVNWQDDLERSFDQLRFGELKVDTHGQLHRLEIQIGLGNLTPDSVRLELYATGVDSGPATHHPMRASSETTGERTTGERWQSINVVEIPASSPSDDDTVRVIPKFPGVAVPLEESHIRWQR